MVLVKVLTLNNRFNLLGIASSLLLFYTALSNSPWWTMAGGMGDEFTFSAEVSPFNIAVQASNSTDTAVSKPSRKAQHLISSRNDLCRLLAG
jgi:hypothetical protein